MDEQKIEKKKRGIIANIFIGLGVIFLLLILLIAIILIVKPYGINLIKLIPAATSDEPISTYDHPLLNTKQESILESVGIDTKSLPSQITAEQQQCAISILGAERVSEIVAGGTPSMGEVLKVKDCFK